MISFKILIESALVKSFVCVWGKLKTNNAVILKIHNKALFLTIKIEYDIL